MIGNDVVDLAWDESRPRARHPRFDARVYAASERRTLAQTSEPWRWIFWAAKESAYKLARRMDATVVFSPRRFEVNLEADLRGRVRWPGGACVVRVDRDADHVHAVAACDEHSLATAQASVAQLAGGAPLRDAARASRAVRELAIADLAPRLGVDRADLEVRKCGRLPSLFADERSVDWTLSLSHHGRFVAFAALPPEGGNAAGAAA